MALVDVEHGRHILPYRTNLRNTPNDQLFIFYIMLSLQTKVIDYRNIYRLLESNLSVSNE